MWLWGCGCVWLWLQLCGCGCVAAVVAVWLLAVVVAVAAWLSLCGCGCGCGCAVQLWLCGCGCVAKAVVVSVAVAVAVGLRSCGCGGGCGCGCVAVEVGVAAAATVAVCGGCRCVAAWLWWWLWLRLWLCGIPCAHGPRFAGFLQEGLENIALDKLSGAGRKLFVFNARSNIFNCVLCDGRFYMAVSWPEETQAWLQALWQPNSTPFRKIAAMLIEPRRALNAQSHVFLNALLQKACGFLTRGRRGTGWNLGRENEYPFISK